MPNDVTQQNAKDAIVELIRHWLPLLDQLELPNSDDSKVTIEMTDFFCASSLGKYWWNEDSGECPEPLLLDIIDVIIGMDFPDATPTFPWETYESIHGLKKDVGLSKEQRLWHYRQQAWMYVRSLVYVLQQRYLPDSLPEHYRVMSEDEIKSK